MFWSGLLMGAVLTGGLTVATGGFGIILFFMFLSLAFFVLVKIPYFLFNYAFDSFFTWRGIELSLFKKRFIKLTVAGILIILVLSPPTIPNFINDNSNTDKNIATAEYKKQYDSLKEIFISLNSTTREDHLIGMINANTLQYSVNENSDNGRKTYFVAYDNEVLRYHKPGDHLEISFDKKGLIKHGEYIKHGASVSALYYNYGRWWDFTNTRPENKYSGYYNVKRSEKAEGIAITYDDGHSVKTHCYPCSSAEEALSKI